MTKKKRYKRYSPEFEREALKRAAEEGATDVRVCEELGISLLVQRVAVLRNLITTRDYAGLRLVFVRT